MFKLKLMKNDNPIGLALIFQQHTPPSILEMQKKKKINFYRSFFQISKKRNRFWPFEWKSLKNWVSTFGAHKFIYCIIELSWCCMSKVDHMCVAPILYYHYSRFIRVLFQYRIALHTHTHTMIFAIMISIDNIYFYIAENQFFSLSLFHSECLLSNWSEYV